MDTNNEYGTLYSQKRLLELLKEFHAFCQDNGVVYSLAAGSLLGAIRHNGFIPWDDDLDVFVDRPNYNKIVGLLSNHTSLMVERDSVESLWVDRVRRKIEIGKGNYIPTLDLLVIDNVPNGIFKRKIKLFVIMSLQGMMKKKVNLSKGTVVYRIGSIVTFVLGKFFPNRLKKKWYRRISQIGNKTTSDFVSNYNGAFADISRLYPSSMMNNIVLHQFEDMQACVVVDWDTCLKTHFGDYMTLPKEEDRKPQHGGKCEL